MKPNDLDRAIEAWKVFHAKVSPTGMIEFRGTARDWPRDWSCVGHVSTIYYRSDKWYTNQTHGYYHTHGKRVMCWHPTALLKELGLGRVDGHEFPLQGYPDAMTVLGNLIGWDLVVAGSSKIRHASGGRGDVLCCTPDRKSLVAADRERGVFAVVAGPGLRVERRGIVG